MDRAITHAHSIPPDKVAKVSKQDKEAADLDAFKAAREAMAAAAAAKEAGPAAKEAAPAAKEEPKPLGGGTGKWVPKGKR